MSILLKKVLLSFLSFFVLFFSIAPNFLLVKAQSAAAAPWYNQDFKTWLSKVNDESNPSEIFGERYTAAQVQWVIYGLFAFILNSATSPEAMNCVFSNSTNLSSCSSAIQGLLGPTTNNGVVKIEPAPSKQSLISLVFADRPFSGIGYVKEKLEKFSLVPVAHAQTVGFGYDALKPIQEMWSTSRNIAFGLFVLAAVVFSFMIMFRVKISPQVVITVQSAIPKLVFSLIAVTFSYAIAGFLIDLMYVVIGLLSVVMSSFIPSVLGFTVGANEVFEMVTKGNPLGTVGINLQLGIFGLVFAYLSPLILVLLILTVIVVAASSGFLFWVPAGIAILVVIIGLWMSIKTVWALLKAFVNIILLTIFAPLQIVAGTLIPNFGFGQWIKSFISHLSVFVVTGALAFFSIVFLMQGIYIGLKDHFMEIVVALFSLIASSTGLTSLTAASAGNAAAAGYSSFPPLLGSGDSTGIGVLLLGVSFVLFTMIPKATELVQSLLAGKPFAYGSAVGEALGPAKMAWNKYGQPITGTMEKIRTEDYVAKTIERLYNEATRRGLKSQATSIGLRESKDVKAFQDRANKA